MSRTRNTVLPVAFIGTSATTAARREVLRGQPGVRVHDADTSAVEQGTVYILALPVRESIEEMKRLLRRGCHVFLDVIRSPSARDLEDAARIAEEAGVSVAISRPLRFAAEAAGWSGRAALVAVRSEIGRGTDSWHAALADGLDLAAFVCGSANARSIEVSAHRPDGVWPQFTVAGLRFDNGSLATLTLLPADTAGPVRCDAAAGPNLRTLVLKSGPEEAAAETLGFLRSIEGGSRAPVSVTDALAVARLQDQVIAHMR